MDNNQLAFLNVITPFSGAGQSVASQQAAEGMADAFNRSTDQQWQMYLQNQSNLQPWLQSGTESVSELSQLMQPGGGLFNTQFDFFGTGGAGQGINQNFVAPQNYFNRVNVGTTGTPARGQLPGSTDPTGLTGTQYNGDQQGYFKGYDTNGNQIYIPSNPETLYHPSSLIDSGHPVLSSIASGAPKFMPDTTTTTGQTTTSQGQTYTGQNKTQINRESNKYNSTAPPFVPQGQSMPQRNNGGTFNGSYSGVAPGQTGTGNVFSGGYVQQGNTSTPYLANYNLDDSLMKSALNQYYQNQQANFGQQAFNPNDLQGNAGYQFLRDEGQRAVEASAAARGGYFSGQTGQDLQRFGQGLASTQEQQLFNQWAAQQALQQSQQGQLYSQGMGFQQGGLENYMDAYNQWKSGQDTLYNRLAGLSGTGQTTGGQLGQAGMNFANQAGQNATGAAGALGQGMMNSANAVNQGQQSGIGLVGSILGSMGSSGSGAAAAAAV